MEQYEHSFLRKRFCAVLATLLRTEGGSAVPDLSPWAVASSRVCAAALIAASSSVDLRSGFVACKVLLRLCNSGSDSTPSEIAPIISFSSKYRTTSGPVRLTGVLRQIIHSWTRVFAKARYESMDCFVRSYFKEVIRSKA